MGVAEERVLPAPEGVGGDRDGNGHVDADHADVDLAREEPRRVTVTREDRHAVPVGVAVHEGDGVVEGRHARDAENGAEDLVVVGLRAGPHTVQETWSDEEAAAVRQGRAVTDDLDVVLLGRRDVTHDAL